MNSETAITSQLGTLRPALLKFARLQLRNSIAAEDVVQETILAVLEKPDQFAGHSSLRTYVIGILKYKIIDHLRSSQKELSYNQVSDDENDEEFIENLFLDNGHRVTTVQSWGNPDASLEQRDFFIVLETCLEFLPAKTARAFMMREWLELESEEICKDLGISASNLWVLIFRARMRLRECLEQRWFGRISA